MHDRSLVESLAAEIRSPETFDAESWARRLDALSSEHVLATLRAATSGMSKDPVLKQRIGDRNVYLHPIQSFRDAMERAHYLKILLRDA